MMSVDTSFKLLTEKCEGLAQALDNILWAVVQGQPEGEPGHALVDQYEAATNDLSGLLQEAQEALGQHRDGSNCQADLGAKRRMLIIAQDRLNRLSAHFYSDLVSYENIRALHGLAKERGGEWAIWVEGVKDALDHCPQPLHEVGQALLDCWQALTEQAGVLSVSVRMSSTGQKFNLAPKERNKSQITT